MPRTMLGFRLDPDGRRPISDGQSVFKSLADHFDQLDDDYSSDHRLLCRSTSADPDFVYGDWSDCWDVSRDLAVGQICRDGKSAK